jgi:hypothetical protein
VRFATTLAALLFGLLASDALAGLVQAGHPITLSDSQRAAIERVACANSPGKTAIGIQAYSAVVYGHRKLAAKIQCDDGIELDAYHAYFERYCTKKGWHWSCEEPPQIRLHMEVAGQGPFEIRLDRVSLDDAVVSVGCLTIALSQNPQVLNGFMAERIPSISAVPSKPESHSAYVEAHNECYWIQYPRHCNANAREPIPVSIDFGCIDE